MESLTSTPVTSPVRLTAREAAAALDARFDAGSPALVTAQRALRLLARAATWQALGRGERLLRHGECIAAYHAAHEAAPFIDALAATPGELMVLRLAASEGPSRSTPATPASVAEFALLQFRDERWVCLDARGEIVCDLAALPAALAVIDGVVLRLPALAPAGFPATAIGYLRWVWRRAWAEVGLSSLWINGGQLLLPLFSMLIYDKVVNNGAFETLWALTLGMLIYLLSDAALRVIRTWSVERLSSHLAQRDDAALWDRLLHAPEPPANGLARLLSHYRELAGARDFVSSTYLLALADLPFIVLYLLAIALVAWPLALVAALLVAGYAWLGARLQMHITTLGRASEKAITGKLSLLGSLAGSLELLRTVPGLAPLRRAWLGQGAAAADAESARRQAQNLAGTLAAAMVSFTSVTLLVVGAYLIDAHYLSVGGLIASNLLAARAMALVASLFMVLTKWNDFQRAAQRFDETLPVAVMATPRVVKRDATGQIDVVRLSKRYPERPLALDAVSCAVRPGERIALIGKPASGKSTLLRALAGLTLADEGDVLFDGVALRDISQDMRCEWLSYKGQDPALFAGTLADNLKLAGGNALDKALDKALERGLWLSGLDEELRAGRLTLGTLIEDQGRNLSGGQRQKVALARALLRPVPILLLDEPGLGLDPDAERLLATRLAQDLGDTTLIMVTHSGELINAAQRLLVLDGGRLVADGPREQLLRAR